MTIIQIQKQKRTGLIKISLCERECVNSNPDEFELLGVVNNEYIETLVFDLKKYKVCNSFYYLSEQQVNKLL